MAGSFKKAFLLIPAYIGLIICCVIVGELAYMAYFNTTQLIAGKPLELFNLYALFEGLFIVVPIVIFLSPVVLSFYRIRHSGGGFLPIVSYIALCAVTWVILAPLFIEFKFDMAQSATLQKTKSSTDNNLTAGYFRPIENDVIYFTKDATSERNEVILLKDIPNLQSSVSVAQIDKTTLQQSSAPFKDVLIKDTVPMMPSWINEGFKIILQKAEQSWKDGYFAWLCFLSIAVAMCSVYALSFCSDWRLINVLYILIVNVGIVAFNLLYYSKYFLQFRKMGITLIEKLPILSPVNEVLLVFSNILIAILCIFIGLLASIVRSKRQKRNR